MVMSTKVIFEWEKPRMFLIFLEYRIFLKIPYFALIFLTILLSEDSFSSIKNY